MAKSEVDRVTEEKVAKGGILVKMYFDMQSEERDKLQPLLVDLINERLLKEPGVVYCYGAIEEPLKRDKYFITSAAVHVLFDNIKALIWVSFKYAPAGLEVLKPQKEIHLNIWDLQAILLDISQLSTDYSRYILEKVLKPEDMDVINKEMENRKELGKKLMEKSDKEKENPKK
jgi:hypothetical protein